MPDSITPPPELVQQWLCSDDYLWGPLEQKSITITANRLQNVAARAALARWGTSNLAQVRSSLEDHQPLGEDDVDLYLEQ
jgi:hypothetical protein